MNNTEWQHKFLKAGTEYGMGDLSMMINIVSEILSEERNKVLDEVKREVEKELEKWDESAEELEDGWGNYTVCLPWELKEKKVEISTIIDSLRV